MKKIIIFLALFLSLSVYAKKGKASFYHDKFAGRTTSSGIIFDNYEMYCAHPYYEFHTELVICYNNNSVIVKVVDRGPYIRGRILDLSYKAAKELDFIEQGVVHVEYYKIRSTKITGINFTKIIWSPRYYYINYIWETEKKI